MKLTFEEALTILDEHTAAPKDGDYDSHTIRAMDALYQLLENDYLHSAIGWVAANDDTDLEDIKHSISVALIADLFGSSLDNIAARILWLRDEI